MSEPKRVPLQTLDLPDTLGSTAKKAEKTKQLEPSFRFELTLQESNEKTCTEYNYDQLLQNEKKKKKKELLRGKDENNTTNGLDPFASDDEDHLKEIARRFEAKYNTSNSSKKKRHKYDDYVDLGAGYDENDSFIDNTDAYDEIVPEEITTAHGGFYINCGALEFKQSDGDSIVNNDNNDNDNEDEDESSEEEEAEDVDSPKRSDKRDNSTSEDEELDDPFKKTKLDENVDKKASNDSVIKKKSIDINTKRKMDDKDSTENNHDENDSKSKKFKTDNSKKFDIKKFIKPTSANGIDMKKMEYKKSNKVEASIESVVKAARVEDDSSQDTLDSGKSRGPPESDSDCDDADKGEPRPALPEGLSESVKEAVNKLKLLGENNKKGKTFTDAVNNELLSLDKKLRHLNTPNLRIQVFEHLAPFLHCSKGALASRAKKLSNQEAENRVKDPVMKLKLIIDRTMPTVEEKYNKECQRVADEKNHLSSNPDLENGTSQKIPDGVPRRRFPWTDETKGLVRDIASARKSYFKIAKPRKQSVEDFVMSFMESEVLPLWPEGWMCKSTLQKYVESESSSKKKHKLAEPSSASVSAATTVIQQNCNSRVEAPSVAYSEPISAKTSVIKNSIPSSLEITKVEPVSKSEHQTAINFPNTIKTSSTTEIKPVIKYKDKHEEREYKNSSVPMNHGVPKVQHQSQHSTNEWNDYSDRSKKIMAHFNFDIPSIKHDLSITPVNDFQKVATKSEVKKDVVSITPYNEPVPVNEGHFVSTSRFEPMDLKNHSDDKDPLELLKAEKRKQKKRERYMDNRHKPHENKIRPESEAKDVYAPSNSHITQLSKEEQEQRQIEETMAATNVLSQLINSCPVQTTIDDPTDQNMDAEKEVQEVHNVMKSLKELEKLRSSPSHSPMRAPQNSGIYLGSYQDDYHRYFQKDDKMRLHKKDGHW